MWAQDSDCASDFGFHRRSEPVHEVDLSDDTHQACESHWFHMRMSSVQRILLRIDSLRAVGML